MNPATEGQPSLDRLPPVPGLAAIGRLNPGDRP